MIIADRQLTVNAQAYRELLAILKKPYQDVCRSCDGTGNRLLRLI